MKDKENSATDRRAQTKESPRLRPSSAESALGASPPDVEGAPEQPVRSAANLDAYIGRQLRAVYDDVAQQPVPDRFLELMRQLEAKTGEG